MQTATGLCVTSISLLFSEILQSHRLLHGWIGRMAMNIPFTPSAIPADNTQYAAPEAESGSRRTKDSEEATATRDEKRIRRRSRSEAREDFSSMMGTLMSAPSQPTTTPEHNLDSARKTTDAVAAASDSSKDLAASKAKAEFPPTSDPSEGEQTPSDLSDAAKKALDAVLIPGDKADAKDSLTNTENLTDAELAKQTAALSKQMQVDSEVERPVTPAATNPAFDMSQEQVSEQNLSTTQRPVADDAKPASPAPLPVPDADQNSTIAQMEQPLEKLNQIEKVIPETAFVDAAMQFEIPPEIAAESRSVEESKGSERSRVLSSLLTAAPVTRTSSEVPVQSTLSPEASVTAGQSIDRASSTLSTTIPEPSRSDDRDQTFSNVSVQDSLEQFWSDHKVMEAPSAEQRNGLDKLNKAELSVSRTLSLSPNTQTSTGLPASMGIGISDVAPSVTSSVTADFRQPLSTQVSAAVIEHMTQNASPGNESLTVRLDPPELGEMLIELSKTKEGLSVRVTAREAVTMDMLLARGGEIESHLRTAKMDLNSLEFLAPGGMNFGTSGEQSPRERSGRMDEQISGSRRVNRSHGGLRSVTGSNRPAGESPHELNFRA